MGNDGLRTRLLALLPVLLAVSGAQAQAPQPPAAVIRWPRLLASFTALIFPPIRSAGSAAGATRLLSARFAKGSAKMAICCIPPCLMSLRQAETRGCSGDKSLSHVAAAGGILRTVNGTFLSI